MRFQEVGITESVIALVFIGSDFNLLLELIKPRKLIVDAWNFSALKFV